jgi:integrase
MRKRTTLSDQAYERLSPAAFGTRNVYVDKLVPGLELRVTDKGRKSWSLLYRVRGEGGLSKAGRPKRGPMRRLTLGDLLPAEARKRARAALEVADGGTDAIAARDAEALERRKTAAQTFGRTVDDYLRLHAKPKYASAGAIERLLEVHVLPLWRDRPIAEIRRHDVVALLDEVAVQRRLPKGRKLGGPGAARDVRKKLSSVFDWAMRRELVEANPCSRVQTPGAAPAVKDRVLTDDEIAKLWSAADRAGHPVGTLFKLLLLTGCRRGEIALAEWGWVTERGLEIPSGSYKSRRVHVVPLSALAGEVLSSIPRRGQRIVTSAQRPGYSKMKRRLDRLSGISDWSFHDLRRTVSTGLGRLGVEQFIIDRTLGHALTGVRAVYNRYEYQAEKQRALSVWGEHVRGCIGDEFPAVVPLKRA